MVERGADAADDARGEARLEPAAVPARQPLGIESERDLERVQPFQELGSITVESDGKRPRGTIAGRQARLALELGDEIGIATCRLEMQLEEPLLAVGRLADGSKHA